MGLNRSIRSEVAVERFGSLGQSTRLQALRLLLSLHPESLAAGEIARRCEVPHNTMSGHLSILHRAGLIELEKDGRAMNYRVDLGGFRGLVDYLARDCCDGKPELCSPPATETDMPEAPDEDVVAPSFNMLFLCTQNSARSIMAEAILGKIGKGRFHAYSAGSEPAHAPLPEVVERLRQLGHDVQHLRSKPLEEFTGPQAPRMDFVIALCDAPLGQFCPDIDTRCVTGAWPLPDPAKFVGSAAEKTILLNELYAMIRRRIEIFTSLPFASLDRMALKSRLDDIGDTNRVSP
jgi:protein-tyrosine-phosphatase/DNA-binding transcriptional ArsR family regulator